MQLHINCKPGLRSDSSKTRFIDETLLGQGCWPNATGCFIDGRTKRVWLGYGSAMASRALCVHQRLARALEAECELGRRMKRANANAMLHDAATET